MSKILVTGGAGFIGTALCDFLLNETDHHIVNVDNLTYAANKICVGKFAANKRYKHIDANICDLAKVRDVFTAEQPDFVMHLAAESHVDRSIENPAVFVQTNVMGTFNMLQAGLEYYQGLDAKVRQDFRFHHVSTDEVYGSLYQDDGAFTEETPYDPRSPYSASKASSDHFVRAWFHTYDFPVVMTNCSNNYGPWQFPEKLIPVVIRQAYNRAPIPIYGKGENIRDWLYVTDHAEALYLVLMRGKIGESYNIGGNAEKQNIDLTKTICSIMDDVKPHTQPHETLISFVTDRKGHDFRYAMDISKISKELGWSPKYSFEQGIEKTVSWYIEHTDWLLQESV